MEIVIKEISNFPYGKVEVKDNSFVIGTSVSKVLVHIQERVDTIFFKKSLENMWKEISVLHCQDLENHKISFYMKLMEIYYLYLEFFPAVLEPRYTIDDGTELLIFHRFSRIYSSSANIAKYSYSIKIADNLLIGEFYKKWKIIRSKEKAVFNLFCFTARCEDYIFETPAAAIIQYIEEYFRCHHGDILEKYGSGLTRQLIDIVKNSINNSNEWIDLFNENGIETPNIINRIKGFLGQLNSCSLRDILIMGVSLYEKFCYTSGDKQFDKLEFTYFFGSRMALAITHIQLPTIPTPKMIVEIVRTSGFISPNTSIVSRINAIISTIKKIIFNKWTLLILL